MNRLEEYASLLAQMEAVPVSDPVGNAVRRQRRRSRFYRSMCSLAAVLCVFVGLINLSPAVSAACRELPLLKELVEALTFNPSLRLAVENEYIQMVGQEQSIDGVTGRVEYLIVDQKQINLFYTLTAQDGQLLDATPELLDLDGNRIKAGIMSYGAPGEADGIRKIVVDFVDETVPDQLRLQLKVRAVGSHSVEAPVVSVEDEWDITEPEILTVLSFDLQFDPKFTAQGRTVNVNQTIELDGQSITVTDMDIYPTHLRINIQEAEDNTAWLKSLRFYLELENGTQIQTISDGISATGSTTTPSMVSYRAESPFFYEADCLRLVITGADFLDKDRETVRIDLETGDCDFLPQGISLHEVKQTAKGTTLTFWMPQTEESHVQLLSGVYYGPDGTEYYCGRMSSTVAMGNGFDDETYYLDDYTQSEVVVKLNYSRFWTPDTPLVVELTEH